MINGPHWDAQSEDRKPCEYLASDECSSPTKTLLKCGQQLTLIPGQSGWTLSLSFRDCCTIVPIYVAWIRATDVHGRRGATLTLSLTRPNSST